MTLSDIKSINREYLTPAEVAAVLGCDAQGIRVAARECPERLQFRFTIVGSRIKIPKQAFIRWMEGQ